MVRITKRGGTVETKLADIFKSFAKTTQSQFLAYYVTWVQQSRLAGLVHSCVHEDSRYQ